MATIVSILSEQLIPNVLFIKQMGKPGDKHVFISTEEMEQRKRKSETIVFCLNLKPNQYKVMTIDANSPALILAALKKFNFPPEEHYVVNITGGNKIMSQFTYLHFKEFKNVVISYWPIQRNVIEQLHPDLQSIDLGKVNSLPLETYVNAHGFNISSPLKTSFPFSVSNAVFNNVIANGKPEMVPEIRDARSAQYVKDDKGYYNGIWFEEWMYDFLKKELKLAENAIAFNVQLKSIFSERGSESDAEIDVAFVYRNKLFIWECKVYNSGTVKGTRINEAVNKISSFSPALGIQATSIVAILSPFGPDIQRKKSIVDNIRLRNVAKVFSLEDMRNKHNFITEVKKIIHYEP